MGEFFLDSILLFFFAFCFSVGLPPESSLGSAWRWLNSRLCHSRPFSAKATQLWYPSFPELTLHLRLEISTGLVFFSGGLNFTALTGCK